MVNETHTQKNILYWLIEWESVACFRVTRVTYRPAKIKYYFYIHSSSSRYIFFVRQTQTCSFFYINSKLDCRMLLVFFITVEFNFHFNLHFHDWDDDDDRGNWRQEWNSVQKWKNLFAISLFTFLIVFFSLY